MNGEGKDLLPTSAVACGPAPARDMFHTCDNKEITGGGGGASYKNNYQKYCTVLVAGWLGSAGTFFFVLVCLIFFYNKCVTYIIRGKVTVKTTSIF